MKILSWNVNGLRSIINNGGFKVILEMNYDLICLQEVKINDDFDLRSIVPLEYFIVTNYSQAKGRNGVVVLTKLKPVDVFYCINHIRLDNEGRFLYIEFDNFNLINLYMPHGKRDKSDISYKLEVSKYLLGFCEANKKDLIITTDFNIAHTEIDVDRYKDNFENTMFSIKERAVVDEMLKINMIDSYRYFNSSQRKYSWWTYAFNARERNMGWRIDYIFVSSDLLKYIIRAELLNDIYGSDHCPTELVINI